MSRNDPATVAPVTDDVDPDDIIGLTEASRLLGISPATAKRHARAGIIPGQLAGKVGARYRIRRSVLLAFLNRLATDEPAEDAS